MIKWKDTSWDDTPQGKIKRHKETGEPVTGKVIKKGHKHIEDTLFITFEQGVENGPFYIEHGSHRNYDLTKGECKNGKIIGTIKKYYDDGNTLYSTGEVSEIIRATVTDQNGKPNDIIEFPYDGEVKYFRKDGSLLERQNHYKENNKRIRDEVEYYPNGQIKSQKSYYDLTKPRGEHKLFYKDGTLKAVYEHRNGKVHGLYREYYSNGVLKKEGLFKNRFQDGKWVYYDKNGNKEKEGSYAAPLDKFGVYERDQRDKEIVWDDYKNGEWFYYDENENLVMKEEYKNGVKHGFTTKYHKDGTTTRYKYIKGRFKGEEGKIAKFFRQLNDF